MSKHSPLSWGVVPTTLEQCCFEKNVHWIEYPLLPSFCCFTVQVTHHDSFAMSPRIMTSNMYEGSRLVQGKSSNLKLSSRCSLTRSNYCFIVTYWAAELWEHFHQDYYSSLRSKHSLPEDIGKQVGGWHTYWWLPFKKISCCKENHCRDGYYLTCQIYWIFWTDFFEKDLWEIAA